MKRPVLTQPHFKIV